MFETKKKIKQKKLKINDELYKKKGRGKYANMKKAQMKKKTSSLYKLEK